LPFVVGAHRFSSAAVDISIRLIRQPQDHWQPATRYTA
jgi:hypothetical protein